MKLTPQELEGWGYRMVTISWSYLQPFLYKSPVWRTDSAPLSLYAICCRVLKSIKNHRPLGGMFQRTYLSPSTSVDHPQTSSTKLHPDIYQARPVCQWPHSTNNIYWLPVCLLMWCAQPPYWSRVSVITVGEQTGSLPTVDVQCQRMTVPKMPPALYLIHTSISHPPTSLKNIRILWIKLEISQ